jgi:uncharacterized delta-60 repeat protein
VHLCKETKHPVIMKNLCWLILALPLLPLGAQPGTQQQLRQFPLQGRHAQALAFGEAAMRMVSWSSEGGQTQAEWTEGTDNQVFRASLPGIVAAFAPGQGQTLLALGQREAQGHSQLAVWRLLPGGSLDPAFGQGGEALCPLEGQSSGEQLLLRPDGSLWVAGACWRDDWAGRDLLLARLSPSGDWEEGIGFLRFDVGSYDRAQALLEDGEERLLLAAEGRHQNWYNGYLLRLAPDGRLDSSFGEQGRVRLRAGLEHTYLSALALQPDGKILAAGQTRMKAGAQGYDWTLYRLLPQGAPDIRFGSLGVASYDLGGADYVTVMRLQADGAILLGGVSNYRPVVMRLNAAGFRDGSFGRKGIARLEMGGHPGDGFSCLQIPPGSICLGGRIGGRAAELRLASNPLLPSGGWQAQASAKLRLSALSEARLGWEAAPAEGVQRYHLRLAGGYELAIVRMADGSYHSYVSGRYQGPVPEAGGWLEAPGGPMLSRVP